MQQKLDKSKMTQLKKENRELRRSRSWSHTCASKERIKSPFNIPPIETWKKNDKLIAWKVLWDEIFRLRDMLKEI